MKVKFLKDYLNGTVLFKAGEEKEIEDSLACKLISDRFAESTVKQIKPLEKVIKVETVKETKKGVFKCQAQQKRVV